MTPAQRQRDLIIKQFAHGNNMRGLAGRYGLTIDQVEAIIRRAVWPVSQS